MPILSNPPLKPMDPSVSVQDPFVVGSLLKNEAISDPLKGKPKLKFKLRKSEFSRSRHRERSTGDYFHRASFALLAYVKVLFDFFFSPAVATTSILVGDLFLVTANVFLALGYLSNFANRIAYKKASLFEAAVTTLGLVVSIAFALYLIPTASFLAVSCVVATAINYVFLVKNVIIPPLKHMVENLLLYFGFRKSDYIQSPVELLNEKNDKHVIRQLLGEPLNEQNKHKLDSYNKALEKLEWYHNKYNEELFGSILRKESIEAIQVDIKSLTVDGNASSALAFFDKKISFKRTKLANLEEVLTTLTFAAEFNDIEKYNRLGFLYFENYAAIDAAGLKGCVQTAAEALYDEANRQAKKLRALEECIPRH